jgi:hypothetical protein
VIEATLGHRPKGSKAIGVPDASERHHYLDKAPSAFARLISALKLLEKPPTSERTTSKHPIVGSLVRPMRQIAI